MMLSRRSLFRGLGAILATPPVAKIASLIPPLKVRRIQSLDWMKYNEITREAVRRFAHSNSFLQSINLEFAKDSAFVDSDSDNGWQWPDEHEFGKTGAKIGSQLRIRLPSDYRVS